MKKNIIALIFAFIGLVAHAQQKVYNIVTYGAIADGRTSNTKAIQQAIDEAAANGGGRVLIPAGYYLTGQLYLKSNIELHLAIGATLLGSTNRLDYSGKIALALINAKGEKNISITGKGTINGQGRELVVNMLQLLTDGKVQDTEWKLKRPAEQNRPDILFITDCKNVKVTGITLKDASSWVQNYTNCTDVVIDHMTVESVAYWNNDGIDIVDCKDVKITNSYFNAADDAICLKSESADKICENVVVENCTLRSSANGFKLGTASVGGFKNIRVHNLTVYNTYRSAIALESVDGGGIEYVDIQNVTAKNTGNAIFIRLGHRNQDDRWSTIQHIYISNVKAEIPAGKPDMGYPMEGPPPKVPPHNLVPSSITGLPGHPVKDVMLENIDIVYGGGAQKQVAEISLSKLNDVTENAVGYPEFTMFGELPAWGMYIRHADGVKLKNIRLAYLQDDFRPAIVTDDVKGLNIDLLAIPTVMQQPAMVLHNTPDPSVEKVEMPVVADKGLKQ